MSTRRSASQASSRVASFEGVRVGRVGAAVGDQGSGRHPHGPIDEQPRPPSPITTLVEMATPEEVDSLEDSLTNWIGATNASTWLQLLGSRPHSSDLTKNPLAQISLIADLHDAITEHGDHELAHDVLEGAGYPASYWVPTCSASS